MAHIGRRNRRTVDDAELTGLAADSCPEIPPRTGARTSSLVEARSIDHVPESERRGTVGQQGPFWFLVGYQPVTLALGFVGPVMGLSLAWTVIASCAGAAIGTLFVAFHAIQGPALGLPQMIQSRAQFGYRGVLLPLMATLFTFLGYNVVNIVVVKTGLHSVFGTSQVLAAVAATAVGTAAAVLGHDLLHHLFRALFWLSLPLWIVLTVGVVMGRVPHSGSGAGGFTLLAFVAQFSVTASYSISNAPYVSDYTRYLPRDTKPVAIITTVFAASIGAPLWLIPLGAWMAISFGATNALAAINSVGNIIWSELGTVLVILSVVVLVALIGLNSYSGMLTVITAMDSLRPVTPTRRLRAVTVVVFSALALAIGLMLENSTATLDTSLLIMLYLLVPWTAINLTDYFIVHRGDYALTDFFTPQGEFGAWSAHGLGCYLAGVIAQVPFMVLPFFVGPAAAALGRVDLAFVVGLVVSAVLYVMTAAPRRGDGQVRRSGL